MGRMHAFNYSRDRSLDDKPGEYERKVLFCLFLLHSGGKEICHKNRRSLRFMTLRLNARKNFNDFDSRWMCVLTHFRPTSEKTSGLFASLFWWSNTFVVRVHHRQAFDFRFFLEIFTTGRERQQQANETSTEPASSSALSADQMENAEKNELRLASRDSN